MTTEQMTTQEQLKKASATGLIKFNSVGKRVYEILDKAAGGEVGKGESLSREPVLIIGTHGMGKSVIAREIGLKYGFADFQAPNCYQRMDIKPLIGGLRTINQMDPATGKPLGIGVQWVDGLIPRMTRPTGRGGVLVLEEITRAPGEIHSRIFSMTEDGVKTVTVYENGENGYVVHPDFWFVATANPATQGYYTTRLDNALMDRFKVVLEINEPLADELGVLLDILPVKEFGTSAEALLKFGLMCRRKAETHISTRSLIGIAKLMRRGVDHFAAVSIGFINKLEPDYRTAALAAYRGSWETKWLEADKSGALKRGF